MKSVAIALLTAAAAALCPCLLEAAPMLRTFSLKQTAAPAVEPVDLTLAKLHCEVVGNAYNTLLTGKIQSAREVVEIDSRRALITQEWELRLDAFPCAAFIEIPKPPLQSVASLKYIDPAGELQTWSSDNYTVDDSRHPGRVNLAYGHSWPAIRCCANAIVIAFTCGYGDAASDVPAAAVQAMLLQIATMFRDREMTKAEERSYWSLIDRFKCRTYP